MRLRTMHIFIISWLFCGCVSEVSAPPAPVQDNRVILENPNESSDMYGTLPMWDEDSASDTSLENSTNSDDTNAHEVDVDIDSNAYAPDILSPSESDSTQSAQSFSENQACSEDLEPLDGLDDEEIDASEDSVFAPIHDHLVQTTDEPETDTERDTEIDASETLSCEGINNLHHVSDELYRSGQPDADGLISVQDLGIQTVLSLQVVNLDTVLEGAQESGLNFEHVSMVPWNVTEDNLLNALTIIRDAPKPILVHCLHGSDRTGLVVAFYRILFQGWTIEDARTEMTSDAFGYHPEFENLLDVFETADYDALHDALFIDQ